MIRFDAKYKYNSTSNINMFTIILNIAKYPNNKFNNLWKSCSLLMSNFVFRIIEIIRLCDKFYIIIRENTSLYIYTQKSTATIEESRKKLKFKGSQQIFEDPLVLILLATLRRYASYLSSLVVSYYNLKNLLVRYSNNK